MRNELLAAANKLKEEEEMADKPNEDIWDLLSDRIRDQTIIPIVGDSVRLKAIFNINDINQLAEAWHNYLSYPMTGKSHSIARLAEYNLVHSNDEAQAKAKYLAFLKGILMNRAEGVNSDVVEELKIQLNELSFTDIVNELEYPRFESVAKDPLRILARLPIPIYITTSYFTFLEKALFAEGKKPRTEVCFWSGEPANVKEKHKHNPDIKPDEQRPLVYHLFGLEAYPETLVLSENDYLDFLMKISRIQGLFPYLLRGKIAASALVLLGYRPSDWDFRTLFHGVVENKSLVSSNLSELKKEYFKLILQLLPNNDKAVQSYLKKYFQKANFKVEWGDTDSFIHKLWQHWDGKFRR